MLAEINCILIDTSQRPSTFLTGIRMAKYLLEQLPLHHLIFFFPSQSILGLKHRLQIHFQELIINLSFCYSPKNKHETLIYQAVVSFSFLKATAEISTSSARKRVYNVKFTATVTLEQFQNILSTVKIIGATI